MNTYRFVLTLLACFIFTGFGHANKVEAGLKAINQLLKKAAFWHNFAYGEKVYLKRGGYQQALMDFESVVDPKTVKTLGIGYGKTGTVGDKTIRLLEPKGLVQMPAISVSDTSNQGLPWTIIKYRS